MAVDEALLETAANQGIGTLRFYVWNQPTLSLGYFQPAADRQAHPPSQNCPLVRRASGGGAILHDRELTYSIALPQAQLRGGAAGELYAAMHETLVETLAIYEVPALIYQPAPAIGDSCRPSSGRQPFLCFERRTCGDVVSGEAKIAGSAQRRRRGAILQHGSVLLSRSSCAPELPGIAELTGRVLSADPLRGAWKVAISARLPAILTPSQLTEAEKGRAHELAASRFDAADYNFRR
jgi:lipoate-protein ligase A